jgi:hypothetical protein
VDPEGAGRRGVRHGMKIRHVIACFSQRPRPGTDSYFKTAAGILIGVDDVFCAGLKRISAVSAAETREYFDLLLTWIHPAQDYADPDSDRAQRPDRRRRVAGTARLYLGRGPFGVNDSLPRSAGGRRSCDRRNID